MMQLNFSGVESKQEIFDAIEAQLESFRLRVVAKDVGRPWGGFFVIEETQAPQFAKLFFPHLEFSTIQMDRKLSPKILIVQPKKRLSWQYHHRRSEIWKVVEGEVGVVTSETDEEGYLRRLKKDYTIELKQGQRHRLVGLEGWGIVAEIWQHTDVEHPSDEDDIVRVQDDFGR